ncbi:unnamed protein product [Triticum turgidum subsp. durum]|uniref:Cytochrome P450 n=1 Tax=Triticum turgidum subsp. durum TaxID=4567 RepID=A0A9R0VEV8_TRITD|nr:unnamed protein product [Triticum turgidum subsp. durum]
MLQLGQVPTLVVSSREGAREVMKNHDTMFATRPLSTTMRVLSYGGQDIVFAPYGEYWRQLRKIAVSELFTARRVLSGAEECRHTLYTMLDGIVEEHLERMDGGGGHAEDLLDVLLKIQKEGGLKFPIHMDAVKAIILDVFSAGSETTTTTIEWAISELINNPVAMQKATTEVRQAFHASGTVAEHALSELPYLRLVIRETLRLHPPLPLLFRECQEPCQVQGYDVQRGTQVLVNAWSLGRDERYWPDAPEEFRPERFEEEAAKADFGGGDFAFLPFGAGRRMCPGMAFGLAGVELPLASMLFHFDWKPPGPGSAELDMTETFGLTARRTDQLPLRPVLRVPILGV